MLPFWQVRFGDMECGDRTISFFAFRLSTHMALSMILSYTRLELHESETFFATGISSPRHSGVEAGRGKEYLVRVFDQT